ncbi:MAG: DNA polymerase I [Bacteroidetes bacterium]|nr:DNA polymerase I [Bacteroidota bacterium]MBL7103666.1 DNA polymerase I [Bacteroidales bacterium]
MPETKKLFLLDAMALIYRAYFALSKNPRINSKGLNTSAILGFANTLYDVIKNEKPTHIGVAFDTMVPTVRHEGFIEYKANRDAIPEDLAISIPYIKKLIEAFNIPILYADGYEADDVIGTLVKKAEHEDFITYMMTPDKDFGQLVTEKTLMLKPGKMGNKPEVLGIKEICEKFGIERTEQIIDILGLWGDASDNIPGIPGIGEKWAKELIGQFGSLENVIDNADNLKGKMKENVKNFAEQGRQSKELATIILNVPIDFDEEQLEMKEPDEKALRELLDELEFRAFAKRVFTDISIKKGEQPVQGDLFSEQPGDTSISGKQNINNTAHQYYPVKTKLQRIELIKKLEKSTSFCFDTETTGIDAHQAELVGMSFSVKPGEAWFVILSENYNECREIVKEFRSLFENPEIEKIGQNIKYDISMLKWYDVEVKGKLFDTMLAHYLLQPDMRHNMDVLAENYLNYKPVPIEDLIGKKGKNQLSIHTVDIEILKDYACEDADITLQLKNTFEPLLAKTNTLKLFKNIEMPLVPVLASMEAEGVKVDIQTLNEYSLQLEGEIKELEKEIHEQADQEFNIASPKQLGEILFEKLRITDKPKLTKTKQYSTGEDVLIKLINKHPIVQNILDFRSLTKLKSTYVDTLPEMVNPRTGRIHTSYNQAVTATGRLSSNNPNLQNIPIRTERGREIRKAFVPRNDNYTLLAADYSQIELRIIAELSGDEGMIEAFRQGIDVHSSTASKIYGVPIDQVSRDMRRNAKTVNFGIAYGISAFGLSERLNIPRKEAKTIIEQYFEKYPGISAYMEKTIEFAREHGYVETMMGRRRYLRDINSNNHVVRSFAERNAINAPIQGSSADMIKIAMINIYKALNEKNLKTKMILQVHDELIFDANKDELNIIEPIVRDLMVNAIPMKFPVVVDMNTGNNWLEAH